ncbi:MAG: amidohydrolase [Phenylobacterium sp.]|nr:amidohydrolase [Phenylobacterium sp.]
MSAQYDIVIRGGAIYDGTGRESYKGDVGIIGQRIAAIGQIAERGREEVDARGKIVTPGFVDIHTHYDGQATWEQRMQPSSWHGVTTVIGGNCGVGFAPCRPAERDLLVKLMEGIEDVPEAVMTKGLPWTWESFPEYLDYLDERQYDVDVGVQVPHSPIRVYVMGERGANREPATPEDIARMSQLVEEGVRQGAFGVSTSRFIMHRTRAGEIAPTVDAAEAELVGLAQGLRRADAGVFQIIPAIPEPPEGEYRLMQRIVQASHRPLSFTLMAFHAPRDGWREFLQLLEQEQPAEAPIRGQVYPRPAGVLFGLDLSFHPFRLNPSYQPLAKLPLAERVAEMRKPNVRARLLAEAPEDTNPFNLNQVRLDKAYYLFGDPPQYEPTLETELGRQAERRGMSKAELIYDMLLEDEGKAILYCPSANFPDNSLDAAGELMRHPHTVIGLGDGGAHYGMICDASYPTFLLTHWVRDASPQRKIALPTAIKALTSDPAAAIGLTDRGTLAVGLRADVNVIDLERLRLHRPTAVYDLPANGRRLRQQADGYTASLVAGTITYRDGVATGALPGRLVRRGQTALSADSTQPFARSGAHTSSLRH